MRITSKAILETLDIWESASTTLHDFEPLVIEQFMDQTLSHAHYQFVSEQKQLSLELLRVVQYIVTQRRLAWTKGHLESLLQKRFVKGAGFIRFALAHLGPATTHAHAKKVVTMQLSSK